MNYGLKAALFFLLTFLATLTFGKQSSEETVDPGVFSSAVYPDGGSDPPGK